MQKLRERNTERTQLKRRAGAGALRRGTKWQADKYGVERPSYNEQGVKKRDGGHNVAKERSFNTYTDIHKESDSMLKNDLSV